LRLRYTFKTVNKTPSSLLLICTLVIFSAAEETSFHRIHVPDAKGSPVNAVLTFSDQQKAIIISPAKGNPITIPYASIDNFVYEYTRKHHVSEKTIATAPLGVGAVAMIRKSRNHWLRIDYHQQELPKVYVVRMDKKNYLRILDAVKAHTGKDAEVLGNADKRRK
jgi:hypothetical protein